MKPTSPLRLKPWQAKAAPAILESMRKHGAALDMSDLGTGKTFTALEVAEKFLPAGKILVVVAPKATLPAWRDAAKHFSIQCVMVLNYENVRAGKSCAGRWVSRSGEKFFMWNNEVGMIVFDEAQRLRSPNGINLTARLSIGAKLSGIPQLALSATLAESLTHMRTAGFAIGLHNGKDFVRWAIGRGCRLDSRGELIDSGPKAKQRAIALNAQLIPEYGARVRREEIPDFPETQITTQLIELPSVSEIVAAYRELKDALDEIKQMAKGDAKIKHAIAAAGVKRLRARQRIELVKAEMVSEIINDAVEEGMSVVLFANFRITLKYLLDNLTASGNSPAIIFGGQSAKDRQRNIDDFQSNKTNVCLVQIQSGGAGLNLHDIHGTHPRLALHFPTYNATEMRQATGRVHRNGGTKSVQKILFAAGTIEEEIMKRVSAKLERLDLINDADLQEYQGLSTDLHITD